MKKLLFAITTLFIFTNCSEKKTTYEDKIRLAQYKLNTQYADEEDSPLTKEDLKTFKTLDFFEINKNYRVEADFELTPNTPIFAMATTTERLPLYRKYGIARFSMNDQKIALSVYQSQDLFNSTEYENQLFLPFHDATNGNLSYGGGRYLDLEIPSNGSNIIIIDFNKAYNPYCAYNSKWSCPIVPAENTIPIEILAGVKAYGKHH
ncbi:MAG: DUF1684 domain-containing protein [Lutibacter sp.]|uniref:DUF1684 domain-containing protein n=1 Tax=Lutibacter sp. TaxID=1925666 RepID=UPI0017EC1F82|nr:DUF1684 domain-containing protein [Lutibacter sp.]MBT8317548.1 DUF1684 domain-containing protein [Lutibacter sp.]NNJ58407.1 DUF1684 domain-containing protein [Lutibacter sp.]